MPSRDACLADGPQAFWPMSPYPLSHNDFFGFDRSHRRVLSDLAMAAGKPISKNTHCQTDAFNGLNDGSAMLVWATSRIKRRASGSPVSTVETRSFQTGCKAISQRQGVLANSVSIRSFGSSNRLNTLG